MSVNTEDINDTDTDETEDGLMTTLPHDLQVAWQAALKGVKANKTRTQLLFTEQEKGRVMTALLAPTLEVIMPLVEEIREQMMSATPITEKPEKNPIALWHGRSATYNGENALTADQKKGILDKWAELEGIPAEAWDKKAVRIKRVQSLRFPDPEHVYYYNYPGVDTLYVVHRDHLPEVDTYVPPLEEGSEGNGESEE